MVPDEIKKGLQEGVFEMFGGLFLSISGFGQEGQDFIRGNGFNFV